MTSTSTLPTTDHPSVKTRTLESPQARRVAPHAIRSPAGRVVGQATTAQPPATRAQSPTGMISDRPPSGTASRSPDASPSSESISRLISETAHDLRAPLATIREAVRLVRDGDLGQVSTEQTEYLSAAMNQCDCAVQLVEELVQSRRFDSA